jgi:hypothetical protein
MGGVVDAIFGGGSDNSGQMAAIEAENARQRKTMEDQQAKLDDEARRRQEQISASAKARRGGGTRALMDAQRLNPEVGLPGQDSSTRTTLGPKA